MMAQMEITGPRELLGGDGRLVEEGWARKPFWRYDRSKVAASPWRLKEWDYYYVISHDSKYGITFTMSDLGYLGLFSVAWLDLASGKVAQSQDMTFLPFGKTGFSEASEETDLRHEGANLTIAFSVRNGERRITASCPGFVAPDGSKGLEADLLLVQPLDADSMNIATSWKENRKAFYYNRKINCMPASGTVRLGSRSYNFKPETSFGGLDWGRGVWTYKNRWYWGSASGLLDGVPFGWNIGYGFSDRSPASENMLFYGGRAHKLEEVSFRIPGGSSSAQGSSSSALNYLAPWKFESSDGRFEMDFQPLVDRSSSTDLLLIKSIQHQVFGYFTGQVILDDGRPLKVERFLGFAEDVLNWW
jgi:hypothetical protein